MCRPIRGATARSAPIMEATGGRGGTGRAAALDASGRAGAGCAVSLADAVLGARTFESLRRYRNFRLFLAGQFVSQTGTWLQTAAQSWLVLQITHSAVAVGLVGFWQFVPYTVLGLFGGTVSDRVDSRRALAWAQVAQMACAALLAALAFAHAGGVAWVYALAAARGVALVVNNPSQQALMLRMVGREDLAGAISLNSGITNATRILGPGVAGVLIAAAGVGWCFALNAASYLAVLASLALMREEDLLPLVRPPGAANLVRDLREGLAYGLRTPRVLIPLALLAVISTLGINFGVMLPILAAQTLGAGAGVYGFITSLFGLGAVAGALLAASLGRATWPLLMASAAAFSLAELALAPERALWPAVACLVATGVAYTLYTSVTNTMVQLSAPDHMQGRVTGLYSYVFLGTGPLGALWSGWLSGAGGTGLTFAVAGAGGLVATAAAWVAQRRAEGSVGGAAGTGA